MMNSDWKKLLFLQVPLAALILAVVVQAVAFGLSAVPMRRDRSDELALAVLRDPRDYRIVLLGDSITRNATTRYSLSEHGEVANLATHAHVGLAGEFFLLKRYLSVHQAPEHVVLSFAPDDYQWVSATRLIRYHLWYTFRQSDERAFIKTYVPQIETRDYLPAILDIQERIFEPFISLLKNLYSASKGTEVGPAIAAGSIEPDPNAAIESRTGPNELSERANLSLDVPPINEAALSGICDLSKQYGFELHVVWPPMPAELKSAMMASGALPGLERKLWSLRDKGCRLVSVFDFNEVRAYTGFRLDMIHLLGDGWEQRFASDLRKYLSSLTVSSSSRHNSAMPTLAQPLRDAK